MVQALDLGAVCEQGAIGLTKPATVVRRMGYGRISNPPEYMLLFYLSAYKSRQCKQQRQRPRSDRVSLHKCFNGLADTWPTRSCTWDTCCPQMTETTGVRTLRENPSGRYRTAPLEAAWSPG